MLKIVRVDFPFTDNPNQFKARPCLLLTKPLGKYKKVILAYITSKNNDDINTNIRLDEFDINFEKTNLSKTSYIQLHTLFTLNLSSIEGEIGCISDEISKKVKENLSKILEI